MSVADRRDRGAILALTGPAYLWLTATIFLPLAAMLYVSFLDKSPLVPQPSSFTLKHYAAFIGRPVYPQLLLWSLQLGGLVTIFSLLVGYPAALALAKVVKGRWREALFAWMSKSSESAMESFKLPTNRVVELGSQLQI